MLDTSGRIKIGLDGATITHTKHGVTMPAIVHLHSGVISVGCTDITIEAAEHLIALHAEKFLPPDLDGDDVENVLNLVRCELRRARSMHDKYCTPHHGWAVIQEEVDELWDEVKADKGRAPDGLKEAVQVASSACRYILDLA